MTSTGLRDRKRLETRARIEEAAVFLVLRDGLDETTVDAISERADVSPRTFFNYFESKDSAILGLHQRELGDQLLAEQLDNRGDQDVVRSVVRLLVAVMGAPLASRATIHDDRLEVIRRHPQVLSGQFAQLSARAGRITETIEQLVTAAPDAPTDPAELRAHAELLLSLCGGAIRVAVREWAAESSQTSIDTIERRATALVKKTAERVR
jgi:AcrR family transcriptional regulator